MKNCKSHLYTKNLLDFHFSSGIKRHASRADGGPQCTVAQCARAAEPKMQERPMKSGTSKIQTRLAALLLGITMLPAYAAGDRTAMSFKDFDTNKDGHLSLDEFKGQGKDDLAFKAADINGCMNSLTRRSSTKTSPRKPGDHPPRSSQGATMQRRTGPAFTPGISLPAALHRVAGEQGSGQAACRAFVFAVLLR